MADTMKIVPGQIWMYDDGIDKNTYTKDTMLVGRRPVLIVSKFIKVSVIPFSSTGGFLDTQVKVEFENGTYWAQTDEFQPIDLRYLTEFKGILSKEKFLEINNVFKKYLENNIPPLTRPVREIKADYYASLRPNT